MYSGKPGAGANFPAHCHALLNCACSVSPQRRWKPDLAWVSEAGSCPQRPVCSSFCVRVLGSLIYYWNFQVAYAHRRTINRAGMQDEARGKVCPRSLGLTPRGAPSGRVHGARKDSHCPTHQMRSKPSPTHWVWVTLSCRHTLGVRGRELPCPITATGNFSCHTCSGSFSGLHSWNWNG